MIDVRLREGTNWTRQYRVARSCRAMVCRVGLHYGQTSRTTQKLMLTGNGSNYRKKMETQINGQTIEDVSGHRVAIAWICGSHAIMDIPQLNTLQHVALNHISAGNGARAAVFSFGMPRSRHVKTWPGLDAALALDWTHRGDLEMPDVAITPGQIGRLLRCLYLS